ncbi:hypothetical protein AOLI_G00282490 [Acnodon oligacanthus]
MNPCFMTIRRTGAKIGLMVSINSVLLLGQCVLGIIPAVWRGRQREPFLRERRGRQVRQVERARDRMLSVAGGEYKMRARRVKPRDEAVQHVFGATDKTDVFEE